MQNRDGEPRHLKAVSSPIPARAENLVVNGPGIAGAGSRVVTDALHFEGAIISLQAQQRNHGLDLRIAIRWSVRAEIQFLEGES